MEEKAHVLKSDCRFNGVRPIMMDLPYPPLEVKERNPAYANMLSIDYCGSVSELSAITQYINNEGRLCGKNCSCAQALLGIGMAEMMHLQKLGELIVLLGGRLDYVARYRNGQKRVWTPKYVALPDSMERMLTADIEAEQAAIKQYRMHMGMIDDACVNAVLARIIQDEEYHIMFLQVLMEEVRG
ncbi:MAG TPA: rubrerythrin family protein [Lachnospiraceae bacterium]|nr:rubrerythrin family protein [Lachnospiraceae bacterium]